MLKVIKQARTAVSLLNSDEVRQRAERPVHIGLVAATGSGYAEMEDFLIPASAPRETAGRARKTATKKPAPRRSTRAKKAMAADAGDGTDQES